jgi:hypothetical protein
MSSNKRRFLGFARVSITLLAAIGPAWVVACGGDTDTVGSESGGSAGTSSAASAGVGNGEAGESSSTGGSASSGGSSTGGSSTGGTSGSGGSSATAGTGGSTTTLPPGVCANGIDDDGDGLVDGFDPECTGPADNDEGTFATGIPGDNRDPNWQDCFFDGNSGAGDDDCRYHTDCLYGELSPEDEDCTLTDACVDFCAERTPNGCDCFGCCAVTDSDGNEVHVLLSESCSLANVEDEETCQRCEMNETCGNTCGRCELCLGKTVEDLPEDCGDDEPPPPDSGEPPPPDYTCDNGDVCTPEIACGAGFYCQQGCCIPSLR